MEDITVASLPKFLERVFQESTLPRDRWAENRSENGPNPRLSNFRQPMRMYPRYAVLDVCGFATCADWSSRKVVDADAEHVQMEVDNQLVLMRKDDCCINATQILSLAKKTPLQRQQILKFMEKKTKVEKVPVTTDSPYRSSWVGFQDG